MKSALNVLKDNNRLDLYLYDRDVLDDIIEAMKQYAKQVAQQALNDAAENDIVRYTVLDDWQNHANLKELQLSIINTEIKTK